MDNVCAPLTPICGAIVKSTGKICQCPGDPIRLGRCGRHAPIKPPRKKFEPFECSICMEECTVIKEQHVTKCNHKFHTKCMNTWKSVHRKITCPLCRRDMRPPLPPPWSFWTNQEEIRQRLSQRFPTNVPTSSVSRTPVPIELFNVQPHETWNDALNRVAALLLTDRPTGSYTADSTNMHQAMIYDIWITYDNNLTESIRFSSFN